MRMLFNHGLSAGELYTNTPKKIIDVGWRFMNDTYGWSKSYEDAIAAPFRYCFGLILNKIIEDKLRFVLPNVPNAFIDFEIVTGDKFIEHRQNGRFSDIDFIESDFTGYFLKYTFKSKAYYKELPIYIGGDLKNKFINAINSGERFYTIKDIGLDYFLDDVHKEFNTFKKTELKKLLVHGFRRMHSAIKYGCVVTLTSLKRINCYAYIGKIYLEPGKQIKEYAIRKDRKLRKMEMWVRPEFNGWYYIGLSEEKLKEWCKDNKKTRTKVIFNNIIIRKIQEELYYRSSHVYIFKFKQKKFKGYSAWKDNLISRDVEYLGEAVERKFYPSDKKWKDLIKEYERSS